ncbi:MAG: DUF3347 domain-containing protein [Chlorobi bacterium]|nr:DUF3347 domain-containing protein [Chlorobiota bacterium]
MKYSIIAALILSVVLISCDRSQKSNEKDTKGQAENMHREHKSLADNFAHKNIVILDHPFKPGEATKAGMEQVVGAYISLENALIRDNLNGTNKAAALMAERVATVPIGNMDDKALEAWKNHATLYEQKLKELQHVDNLADKRSYFAHISEIMYCTIKSFGLKENKLFAVYCPMAFDGKGAYWISDKKKFKNPYMGPKMPTCGEIKEEL